MKSKVPASWATYVLKCVWPSTASYILIPAKSEWDAVERAWKKMRRTEGGDKCEDILVKEVRWT